MGSWGPGLYSDDTTADLKNMIALLDKLPASGDRLLEILLEQHKEPVGMKDDSGPAFWLVVADQFERRGIASVKTFKQALTAIDTGADLRDLEARGLGHGDLAKRRKILDELAARLRKPRPVKARPRAGNPPDMVVETGEVYAFPTMKRRCRDVWAKVSNDGAFKPDGWGALLVVASGRVFEWLPWCAASSLSVEPSREPTLDEASGAQLIQDGAQLCVPRRKDMERMQTRLLGRLGVDRAKGEAEIPDEFTKEFAVVADWSIAHAARGRPEDFPVGKPVRDLLAPQGR